MKGFFNTTHTNNGKFETKQDKKPDGINELIDPLTKKISKQYLPESTGGGAIGGDFVPIQSDDGGANYGVILNENGQVVINSYSSSSGSSGNSITISQNGVEISTKYAKRPIANGEAVAYLSDIETEIGDINSILDFINGEVI